MKSQCGQVDIIYLVIGVLLILILLFVLLRLA
jgi:hypothetical protein